MDENRVEGMARTIGGKVEGVAGDLTGDQKLKADGVADKVAGKAQRAYGNAKDTVRDVAGDYGSGLLDTVEEYGDLLAEKVDERPITALLIAAGVGALLALASKPAPKVVYRRR
jgi:uncharacterized protein YjbJ (UPF0337 family)